MKNKWLAVTAIFWTAGALMYAFGIRELVAEAYDETAPAWFMAVVNGIYPRFGVEKHRFELAFFLRHADQIVVRSGLLLGAVTGFVLLKSRSVALQTWLVQFWQPQISTLQTQLYRWAVYTCVLFFTYDWFEALSQLHVARAFYKPVPLLRLVALPFPPVWLLAVLCGMLLVGCGCVVFRFREILFSAVVAGLFTLLQGWLYSFEKMDHAFAPLTYTLWLMPLFLHQARHRQPVWALALIRLVIGMVYLQAGLEKLLTGGLEWLAPETFRAYLYLRPTAMGLWVAQSDGLCLLFPLLALLFQLGFVSVVFVPKLRWVFLPAGILFHAGTYLLMEVGGYVNAWVWPYVLFL